MSSSCPSPTKQRTNRKIHFLNDMPCEHQSCESTCVGFTQECGSGGYWCLDPNAQDATNVVTDPCAAQAGTFLGNGDCDSELNIPFCNYDEGDCCESTCGVLNGQTCSGPFPNCVDPIALANAPSSSPSNIPSIEPSFVPSSLPSSLPSSVPSQTPSYSPTIAINPLTKICKANPACNVAYSTFFCGDGWCDEELNTKECGWDGGDCCFETCSNDETSDFPCGSGGFQCKDPDNARAFPDGCKADVPEWVGDGICDKWGYYNTPSCNYDGGDCCEEDCIHGPCLPEFFMCVKGCPAELLFLLG